MKEGFANMEDKEHCMHDESFFNKLTDEFFFTMNVNMPPACFGADTLPIDL